ncbi:MAG: cytochrome c [Betaproteobacteria bacterium]|nr:cytochrome c [Betaproteobacteria bacterium]
MRSAKVLVATVAVALAGCAAAPMGSSSAAGASAPPRLGQPISEAQLAKWNIDVRTPDGLGLPPGKGSVADGKKVYDAKCLACHGEAAKGGPVFGAMVGGIGSFKTNTRVLTPGSMYPYAGVLFDYVRRAMPMNAPQSLTDDESYAVSAYILHLNGLMPANGVGDAKTFTALVMPNRDGFISDTRPDVKAERCMSNCPPISSTRGKK